MASKSEKIPFMVDVFPALVKKEYIDVETTEKIKQHLENKSTDLLEIEEDSNSNFLAFENFRFDYENLISCDDVQNPYWYYYGNVLLEERVAAAETLKSFKIRATSYIALSLNDQDTLCVDKKTVRRKYLIFVFSNTILVFINPMKKPIEFLCALDTTALTLTFNTRIIERDIIIRETSREPLDYYKKFNPTPDSHIVSMNWEVTNRDGSRSFRGGLQPENNPLHMHLEYGIVTINICGTHLEYGFSNADLARKVTEEYSAYMTGKKLIPNNNPRKEEIYNHAIKLVTDLYKKTLIERYKALSPMWKLLIPIIGVFGGMMSIAVLVFIIEMIMLLFI